jgi:hypothetical protein
MEFSFSNLALFFTSPLHWQSILWAYTEKPCETISRENIPAYKGETSMKKTLLVVGLIVAALGILGVGVAFAQGELPPMMGTGMMRPGSYGWMHNYVERALAAKLGLTEEQVEEQLAAGKTMYQIALENGIKQEDLATFMTDIHQEAFAKAVKDGALTQEQADWMLQRMQTMFQNGYGPGNCPMHNGQDAPFGRGRGRGPRMMGYGPDRQWGQGTLNP